MKKKLITIITLVALAVLVLSVSTAGAATRRISLLSAKVEAGKGGAVFMFKVYGEFANFNGFVRGHGQQFNLNCNLQAVDDSSLICRAVGSPSMANKTVQVVVNGFSFDAYVESVPTCKPVYDIPSGGNDPTWWNYGDYCTDEKPELGDTVLLDSYFPFGEWEYIFDQGGFCGPGGSYNNFGPAWYWNVTCF